MVNINTTESNMTKEMKAALAMVEKQAKICYERDSRIDREMDEAQKEYDKKYEEKE